MGVYGRYTGARSVRCIKWLGLGDVWKRNEKTKCTRKEIKTEPS